MSPKNTESLSKQPLHHQSCYSYCCQQGHNVFFYWWVKCPLIIILSPVSYFFSVWLFFQTEGQHEIITTSGDNKTYYWVWKWRHSLEQNEEGGTMLILPFMIWSYVTDISVCNDALWSQGLSFTDLLRQFEHLYRISLLSRLIQCCYYKMYTFTLCPSLTVSHISLSSSSLTLVPSFFVKLLHVCPFSPIL